MRTPSNPSPQLLKFLESIRKVRQSCREKFPTPNDMFTNLVRNGIILEWGDREAVALMEERGTTKTFYGTLEHYEPTGNLLEYMKKKFRKGVEVHYHGKKNRGTVEEVTDTEVVVNFKGRIKRIEIKEFFAYGCLVKTNFLFWQEKTHVG